MFLGKMFAGKGAGDNGLQPLAAAEHGKSSVIQCLNASLNTNNEHGYN
jgi:hypothetical protein